MKKKSDSVVLLDIDNTLFNTEKLKHTNLTVFALYDEVTDTLSELSKVATLGIFSQGDVAFQNKKLQQTNIHHYFAQEHKHIVEYKIDVIEGVIQKYSEAKIYFIDDWLGILRIAKKIDPSIFTIWMKRGEYSDTQQEHEDFTPDAVVNNLHDVIPLIIKSK